MPAKEEEEDLNNLSYLYKLHIIIHELMKQNAFAKSPKLALKSTTLTYN